MCVYIWSQSISPSIHQNPAPYSQNAKPNARLGVREVEEGVRDGLELAVEALLLVGRLQVPEQLLVMRVEDVHKLVGHGERAVPVVELAPVVRVAVRDLRQEALWSWDQGVVG